MPGPEPAASPRPSPVPATEAPADQLLELAHGLRTELVARGEYLPPGWVEEAAQDLKAGRLRGWALPPSPAPGGLAFFSPRTGRAYGHVHVVPGPDALPRLRELLSTLMTGLATPNERLDVGLTGLTTEEEDRLRSEVDPARGESALLRFALEADVRSAAAGLPAVGDLAHFPVRGEDLAALATLDWVAFQGTADESLVADSPAEDRRVLDEILRGLLGRFLGEASTVLRAPDETIVGFLLTAEQTPRRAIFLDLVVRPDRRRGGVGTYLLRWGMRALSALGYETVRLWVTETNTAARHLYDRHGFAMTGRALIYRLRPTPAAGGGTPQPHLSR